MGNIGPYPQPTESNTTVDGTSSEIFATNMRRSHASITNLGSTTVFYAFGQAAVVGDGRQIPAGMTVEIEILGDLDQWMCNQINGITSGATVNLALSETVRP